MREADEWRKEAHRAEQWCRARLAEPHISEREAQALDGALRGVIGFRRAMLRLMAALVPPPT